MNEVREFAVRFEDPLRPGQAIFVELVQDTGRDDVNHCLHHSGKEVWRRDDEDFDGFKRRAIRSLGSRDMQLVIFSKRGRRHVHTNAYGLETGSTTRI